MFATHSHSEAQWNESGWFVDQALPPHIEPNHLDPMELPGLCSAPWLRRGVASLRGAGERTCAYIGGHTHAMATKIWLMPQGRDACLPP